MRLRPTSGNTRRKRLDLILLNVTAVFVLVSLLLIPVAPGVAEVAAARTRAKAPFSTSATISRAHLVDGAEQVVEERTFKVSVDQTALLRDKQKVTVNWSGAHPSGGLVRDQDSSRAAGQEYPVAVLQCRGVDREDAPASERMSPETCWTQTPYDRVESDSFTFPPYRLDRHASARDRQATVGVPSPIPDACASSNATTGVQRWIPFRAADGTIYPGGPDGCAGTPPGTAPPATYGASNENGNGSVEFAISTYESNASLGCSNEFSCALVIIPVMGIGCDSAGSELPAEDRPPDDSAEEAFRRCSADGRYRSGEFSPGTWNRGDLAVTGELWWSASNWRNRISVPLTFAQPEDVPASRWIPGGPGTAGGVGSTGVEAAVTETKTIKRAHLVAGAEQVVEERTFEVSVDQTTLLRDRQEINIRWSGAHPTGGLVGDQNAGKAAEQEYPVVLMQCRGVDSESAPASQRLSQETCWTQTPTERSQSDLSFNFPSYRLDRYAAASDRKAQVGVPSPIPEACESSASGVQHWVPFRGADGTVYTTGPFGCAGMAPEAVIYEGALQPSNTTYGATDKSGNGSAQFAISAAESNASLGCSDKVACSIVIIPIIGISCDPGAEGLPEEDRPPDDAVDEAFRRCSATGKYLPGQFSPGTGTKQEDLAVAGELWWSASNWRNRISVPLTFAPPANICDLVSTKAPVFIYGSELMSQATLQWAPAFCLDPKLFKLQHVKTGEPQAKNLLEAGSIEAALEGSPPQTGFTRPIVQAPVALTGFAITYAIDDATGHAFRQLKLTPRLLAKLLTQSYPSAPAIQGSYPALAENPLSLAHDPEFLALNPGTPAPGIHTQPAATLFMISADSDVIWAMTSYIQADPDARAWLDGDPDPWGMVVNPNYKDIKLPVVGWPLLDTFQSGTAYEESINPCLATNPVPYLPLVAAQVSTFAIVTLNIQFGIANSQVICRNPGEANQRLVAIGRENPGQRFIVGVTTLADAERYQLDTAALQTQVASTAPEKFTDDTGRTFVGPSDVSLRAAAGMLKPDEAAGSWLVPYAAMRTDSKGAGAYPGTMLMSVAVPTKGLPKTTAQRYAQFMRFAAVNGQRRGLGNGQLPPGYLPMTAANGLASQVRYTQIAAGAVAAQAGGVPSVVTLTTTTTGSSGGGSGGGGLPGAPPLGFLPPNAAPTPGVPPTVSVMAPVGGRTLGIGSGLAGLAFPLVLLLALFCGVAAALTWYFGRPRTSR